MNALSAGRGGIGLTADGAVGALLATRHIAGHRLRCSKILCHVRLLVANNNINAVASRGCWMMREGRTAAYHGVRVADQAAAVRADQAADQAAAI